jgi:hypothetical protein
MSRTWDTEPVRVVRAAALGALTAAGMPLREAGWDAQLRLTVAAQHEDHFYEVALVVKVYSPGPVPIEARKGGAA